MVSRKEITLGLTYDDILIVPGHSEVVPRDITLATDLTPRIRLNIPLISAAMDTVTEHELAIAMAREGGIGVIHKNLPIADQASEVAKVKRSEAGMISNPITLSPDDSIGHALEVSARYKVSGFPICKGRKLVGILTNRDLRAERDRNKKIGDVMTKKVITVPIGTSLGDAEILLHQHRVEKLPVVDEKGNLAGMFTLGDIMKGQAFPLATKDALGRLRVAAAVGVDPTTPERAQALIDAGVDLIAVDTAHGHSKNVIRVVRELRALYPDLELMAGNIATAAAVKDLVKAGASAVKVGIGPGSICTTRIVTGCGVPQVTAILECTAAANKLGVPVCADGGIKYSGDVTKALAVGASTVMVGSLLAGTTESPGETILYEGRSYKVYRGMGSLGAMMQGSKDRYAQSHVTELSKLVPEGIEGMVPFKGPVSESIYQLCGGVRSGMGMVGAKDIESLRRMAQLIQVTAAGLKESHPHTIVITKEAPNYRVTS